MEDRLAPQGEFLMHQFFVAAFAIVLVANPTQAHFIFLVPAADGKSATAIHSDSLKPDPRVDISKIGSTKLVLRKSGTPDASITWTKEKDFYKFSLPGDGPRQVFAITDYGVMQRGESKPFLLQYQAKAIIGDWSKIEPLGKPLAVEIVPVRSANGVRFRAVASGKPIPDVEINVIAPVDSDSAQVKTDADGLTVEFKSKGQFGAVLMQSEPKSGEHGGKKYEEIRRYATVVVTVPK
jgi:uncharacterized GH25 family protein